jgi:hypothetical protein
MLFPHAQLNVIGMAASPVLSLSLSKGGTYE